MSGLGALVGATLFWVSVKGRQKEPSHLGIHHVDTNLMLNFIDLIPLVSGLWVGWKI